MTSKLSPKPMIKLKLKEPKIYGSLSEEFPMYPRPENNKSYDQLRSSEKGDELVHWVHQLILNSKLNCIISESTDSSGISSNIFDIIIRLKGENYIRGLQVKTLCFDETCIDSWSLDLRNHYYPLDTLMIFINADKNRFVLGYWKDFRNRSAHLHVNFLNIGTLSSYFRSSDLTQFIDKFCQMVQSATIIHDIRDGILSTTSLQEYDYLRIIKSECEKRNIKFEYNWTVSSSIDIYLNGYACQCKTSSYVVGSLYQVNLSKVSPNGSIAYDINDNIQYFIVQIKNPNDPSMYKSDICIIPIRVMIEQGRITTDTKEGMRQMSVAPPHHNEYHWSESMWNNFSIIENNIKTIDDPIYKFINRYPCLIKNTRTKHAQKYDIHHNKSTSDDLNIKYLICFINDGTQRLYKNKVLAIPTDALIKDKKLPTQNQKGKIMRIAPPDYSSISNRHDWSSQYWVDISTLDRM